MLLYPEEYYFVQSQNKGNTRTVSKICLKLTIKTPERRQLRLVFMVTFE